MVPSLYDLALYVFADVCRAFWPFFYIFVYLDNLTTHIELPSIFFIVTFKMGCDQDSDES